MQQAPGGKATRRNGAPSSANAAPTDPSSKTSATGASQNAPTGLARYLSPADAWAMAFGCMVGWGAFVMPGTTVLPVAGPAGSTLALAIGIAIMLLIGTNFSYQISRSTRTGGVYSYTKEAFGRDHAFLSS